MKAFWTVVAFIAVAALAYELGDHRPSSASSPSTPLRPAYVAAEGKVEAMPGFDVDVGTGKLNGRIAKVFVKEGDKVSRGQTVAVLENEDLRAQVAQGEWDLAVARSRLAELKAGAREEEIREAAAALDGARARLQEAQNKYRRNRELYEQQAIAKSTLDEHDTSLKAAQAEVKEAEQRKILLEKGPKPETVQLFRDQVRLAQAALYYARKRLDKTVLRSPIDGTVIERYLDDGEGVTPETPILAIADLDRVWINAEADETDVGRVQVGDKAQVSSKAYPGMEFPGTVREISQYAGARMVRPSNPAVNLGLKVVQVKIALQDKTPLRLGMTVDVKISPNRGNEGKSK